MKTIISIFISLTFFFSCTPAVAQDTDSTPVFQSREILGMREIQENLTDIGKNHASSVVFISTTKIIREQPVSPFDFFYGDPFGRGTPPQSRERQQSGLGSGVIYKRNGDKAYIITNNHVIEGSDEVNVSVEQGTSYEAKVLGADPAIDIAVLEITTKDTLKTALMGDSSLINPGEFAIAVGNPFGLKNTITFGIISAVGRDEISNDQLTLTDFIQTDAAINPGNSGGPLLNIDGEVIGINTMIYSQSGGNIGIGFAVPINIAVNATDQIIETGRVERGYLGIYYKALEQSDIEKLGLKNIDSGMLVSQIVSGSPAEKYGLETGDVIIGADGKKVLDTNDLARTVGSKKPGETLNLEIIRGNDAITIDVILDSKEDSMDPDSEMRTMIEEYGLELAVADTNLKNRYDIPAGASGLVISSVVPQSRAAQQGMKIGDLIFKVNNQRVNTVEELNRILENSQGVTYFYIYRNGNNYIIMM